MPSTVQDEASSVSRAAALKLRAEDVPRIFAEVVSEKLGGILEHQKADGSIEFDAAAPKIYPRQAMMPPAFCRAGLDPVGKWKGDARVAEAIRRSGDRLVDWYDDEGKITYNSYGYSITGVDQRLTYAWLSVVLAPQNRSAEFTLKINAKERQ